MNNNIIMKKVFLFLIFLFCLTSHSQNYKKLIVTTTTPLSQGASIYINTISDDRLGVAKYIGECLTSLDFEIVTNKNEADYCISISYQRRADNYCPNWKVIRKMEGTIFDLKNKNNPIINFTFKQSSFEQKCTSEVILALAKKISAN